MPRAWHSGPTQHGISEPKAVALDEKHVADEEVKSSAAGLSDEKRKIIDKQTQPLQQKIGILFFISLVD